MARAISQVQVSITAQLSAGYKQAFTSADAQMKQLGGRATELSAKIGDINAFRQQQTAAKQVGQEWLAAKAKAAALRTELASASGQQDRMNAEMQQAAAVAKQAASAWTDAKNKVTALQYGIQNSAKPTRDQREALRLAREEAKAAGDAYKATAEKTNTLSRAADQNRNKIAASTRELQRADSQANKMGTAFGEARTKLGMMGQALAAAGINVGKLTQEYKRLQGELVTTQSKYEKQEASLQRQRAVVQAMGKVWGGIQSAAAGAAAATAVMSGPTKKALSYDEQVTYMTDTAAAGKSLEEKQATKKRLSDAIETARRASGGAKREDVAGALNTLIASGQFSEAEAIAKLPEVSRAAFAGGASSDDMAKTAVSLKQYGVSDMGGAFDKILRAGQVGNFEMKDMARWLPQQLALAKSSGITGDKGLTEVLSFNQSARTIAGTSDEAGNNVVNLLQKFTSREFADSMAKNVDVESGDPTKKKGKGKKAAQAFDWSKYMMQRREQGVSAIGAFGEVMERQLAGNKDYVRLQKKMKTATGDERKQTLEAMTSIATGSELGQIIADRQALMGAIAVTNGKQQMAQLSGQIDTSKGAVTQSAEFVGGQTWAKTQAAGGTLDRANENAFNSISGPAGSVVQLLTNAADAFPKLTTAVYAATIAIGALAAAGIASKLPALINGGAAATGGGLLSRLFGGGGAAAATTGAVVAAEAGAAAGAAAATGAATAGKVGIGARLAGAGKAIKGGLVTAAGGYLVDAGAGALGVGGKQIDQAQDDKNWQQATTWEKVQSSIPRGIEKLGSLFFLDNMANQAKSERIASETDYLQKKGQAAPSATAAPATAPVPQEAAKAATAAAVETAKAVPPPPPQQITNTYSYTVTVTAPISATAAEIGVQVDKAIRQSEKKKETDARASHFSNPAY